MAFWTNLLVCTPLERETTGGMLCAMEKAKAEGADVVELRMGSLSFSHISQVEMLLAQRPLPTIVSYSRLRSSSAEERKQSRSTCLQVLRLALELDVEFVEIDYEIASDASMVEEVLESRGSNIKLIVSSHVNGQKPSAEELGNLIASMQSTGADVIKLVIDVESITDLAPVFRMLTHSQVPLIALAVGSRGLISQLLGPKFGGCFVYGSLDEDKAVAGGIPTLSSLRKVYKLEHLNSDTKIFGLISNPVGHSKGPILHNPAFRHTGYNGIYVPMQVDDIKEFFTIYTSTDFAGFSVGIPHKEAAVGCCDEVDPLAKLIGAVNTIVRRAKDGKLVGYNTDCEASISAIEDALRVGEKGRVFRNRGYLEDNSSSSCGGPLAGKTFVVVGAGGAGRALAFGAKSRGAKRIVIFNRNFERAKALAAAVSGEALPYESLDAFQPEKGMILANASAIGMEPNTDTTPVSKVYDLVFDAVYTPRNTRLLQEAGEAGATVVSGVEMFIRQALGQFTLFTGGLAPEAFMRKLVLEQF
ncbi:Bifunctional 3-dehydroquinate dehydratase/shikimate dehydrogenase, chloroplastic [Linum grandiflorum]